MYFFLILEPLLNLISVGHFGNKDIKGVHSLFHLYSSKQEERIKDYLEGLYIEKKGNRKKEDSDGIISTGLLKKGMIIKTTFSDLDEVIRIEDQYVGSSIFLQSTK